MADKAKTKVRNSERPGNGKAWSKRHNAPVKAKSAESLARKAEKDARRAERAPLTHPGPNITLPRIDWNWFGETMASRWTPTRRRRSVDAILDLERRGGR